MERKRRDQSFLGLHFDFHANPETVIGPLGKNLTEDMIREICETIRPDFIQIDCKGHPGWTSYPSKLGNAACDFSQDPLKLWRKVTAECGVALYMHYSGVYDGRYVELHPEEAVIKADGTPHEMATSVFGNYADALLIPQLKELAGEYGVDGIWIDGECWGTDTDYGPKALAAWYKETGIDLSENPPVTPDMPYYNEYRDFCREGFRKYLRYYVDEVHKEYPDFQIASNWAFTDHMPEAVTANVDFLSGDYSPQDSFNTARYCGRIILGQEKVWDLMAWNFRHAFDDSKLHSPKHPNQIKQEAAAVMCLGGGFQNYITQQRDGTPRMNQISLMKDVAAFCRDRQPWCHKGKMLPQAVVYNNKHDHYLNTERIFLNTEYEALRGWTQLLCETQQSVQICSDHNFLDQNPNRFPFAVVSDIKTELDAPSAEKLLAYVKNGGSLVVSGEKALAALAAAGAPVEVVSVSGQGFEGSDGSARVTYVCCDGSAMATYVSGDGVLWATANRAVKKLCLADSETLLWGCENDDGTHSEVYPVAGVCTIGKGKLFAVSYDLGLAYYEGGTSVARDLLKKIEAMAYNAMVKVTGSMYCDVVALEKDGKLMIQLVNTAGGHGDYKMFTIDEITPIGPLTVSIALPEAPKAVTLQPAGKKLEGVYENGRFVTTVDRLEYHEIVVVE